MNERQAKIIRQRNFHRSLQAIRHLKTASEAAKVIFETTAWDSEEHSLASKMMEDVYHALYYAEIISGRNQPEEECADQEAYIDFWDTIYEEPPTETELISMLEDDKEALRNYLTERERDGQQ